MNHKMCTLKNSTLFVRTLQLKKIALQIVKLNYIGLFQENVKHQLTGLGPEGTVRKQVIEQMNERT